MKCMPQMHEPLHADWEIRSLLEIEAAVPLSIFFSNNVCGRSLKSRARFVMFELVLGLT